jgi:hypothetical protein
MDKEDKTIVAWVSSMQDCGLSFALQQFFKKGCKVFTQTKPTPFKDG